MAGIVLSEQETAVLITWHRTMTTLVDDEAEKGEHARRAEEIAATLHDARHQVRSVTVDEFAALVEAALVKADEAELPIETQIEVLERLAQAMREALT